MKKSKVFREFVANLNELSITIDCSQPDSAIKSILGEVVDDAAKCKYDNFHIEIDTTALNLSPGTNIVTIYGLRKETEEELKSRTTKEKIELMRLMKEYKEEARQIMDGLTVGKILNDVR